MIIENVVGGSINLSAADIDGPGTASNHNIPFPISGSPRSANVLETRNVVALHRLDSDSLSSRGSPSNQTRDTSTRPGVTMINENFQENFQQNGSAANNLANTAASLMGGMPNVGNAIPKGIPSSPTGAAKATGPTATTTTPHKAPP